ncbi:MAG: LysE family translocator, partial [Muribaculaceae bacterium]|nr:LysE family translocator [Muribaculaceae bacterium]MDE7342784.1 LysE family translocator [Muribaculaceae bacterium]
MSPLDSILYMIWRGIAVGVLISAPMGPVGILCIQRTLDKGRRAGFYTGIGAAISDLFYCLLTGFGLSFIEDFIERNQNVIQLVGSVVLIAFSVYLFRKDPSSPLRRPVPQNVSARKNILGGFLFTFSNPLIIFLIIGLFARFNFTAPEISGAYIPIGYLFIAAGALGWWYGITYAIDKVRTRFNMRSMKIMNISIGVVILGFATVGIVSSIMGLTSHGAQAARHTLRQYHT